MKRPKFANIPFLDIDYDEVKIVLGLNHFNLFFPEDGTRFEDKESGVTGFKCTLGWVLTGPVDDEGYT